MNAFIKGLGPFWRTELWPGTRLIVQLVLMILALPALTFAVFGALNGFYGLFGDPFQLAPAWNRVNICAATGWLLYLAVKLYRHIQRLGNAAND